MNLKMERVRQCKSANHAGATGDIAGCIVSCYNNVHLHSNLGNLPPKSFEHQSAIAQAIAVCGIT